MSKLPATPSTEVSSPAPDGIAFQTWNASTDQYHSEETLVVNPDITNSTLAAIRITYKSSDDATDGMIGISLIPKIIDDVSSDRLSDHPLAKALENRKWAVSYCEWSKEDELNIAQKKFIDERAGKEIAENWEFNCLSFNDISLKYEAQQIRKEFEEFVDALRNQPIISDDPEIRNAMCDLVMRLIGERFMSLQALAPPVEAIGKGATI